ncbi:hypothetical protein BDQ12DRAFT_714783 [Crucibulum laeve]|uniref:Uncharacterized protein n=1 Tax=Crucibulum laeve TaxID=68775 RepID=A0A5C3M2E8_9AGAR|nr:hypothetical protein BDQ12DRAFT_714783 [Crucibulum laeve]
MTSLGTFYTRTWELFGLLWMLRDVEQVSLIPHHQTVTAGADITPRLRTITLDSYPGDSSGNISPELSMVTRPLRKPSATRIARFPPLPADVSHSKRYYFYGWHLDWDWLLNLAPSNNYPSRYTTYNTYDGILYLRAISGYEHIYPANGLVENREEFDGEQRGVGTDRMIDLLVVWVNKRDLAHRRPTELQLAKLIKTFRAKPRWFKDGRPRKYFDEYEM